MPESYCGDETDLIRYSGNSDSVPDFKNTVFKIGSSANMVPHMTPKSDVHVYVFCTLYMGCYPAQGAGEYANIMDITVAAACGCGPCGVDKIDISMYHDLESRAKYS